MSIEEILKANARFLSKYRRLKPPPANGWAIVTCCDRRLSGLLEAAMGFRPGEAYMVRNAGNTVTPFDNSVVRSLSILVAREGVKNIAVIGHNDCLSQTSIMDLNRVLEAVGVKREFAGSDLREFYGLTGDPSANVRATVDRIASSGLLPTGISIYGLLIEISSGRLTPLCQHTISPVDIPSGLDSSAYRIPAVDSAQQMKQPRSVRGQENVRQFTGTIKMPKSVHSPVSSVKVPVNIRTPVQKIEVPKQVTVHKEAIKVPVKIRMPEKRVNLGEVGREFAQLLSNRRDTKERDPGRQRGQSVGSWKPEKRPRLKPVLGNREKPESRPTGPHKYCPRCGTEYYGHVERCTDCGVRLIPAQEHRAKGGKIKRVRRDNRDVGSRRDHRRRGQDRSGRRR